MIVRATENQGSPFGEDGCPLLDHRNGDQALRYRPVVGLEILRNLRPARDDPARWGGGTIYDPGSGYTYKCTLTMDAENRLSLRGYVGIPLLGRTTTWYRLGTEATRCRVGV